MKRSETGKRLLTLPNLLACLIILLGVSLIGYFILFPAWGYFHSDCTDTILWAQAGYDAGGLFNADFTYACLLPFGGQLLMQPFIGLFGVSTTTHAIGMLLFLALFVTAAVCFCRSMKWSMSWTAIMVTALLLLLSSSEKLREIFWGHIIYYSLGILFLLVGLALAFSTLNAMEAPGGLFTRQALIPAAFSLLWMFLCSTNGLQALTIFAFPLLVGILGERFFDTKSSWCSRQNRFTAGYAGALLLAACAGCLVGGLLKSGLTQGYFDAYSTFSGPDKWMDNLRGFLPHWLTLLGVDVAGGEPLADFDGIRNLVRIGFAILLLLVPVAMTLCYRRYTQRYMKILLITHWTLTALIMMAYVFGSLSAANWRLSPIVASSILLLVAFSRWLVMESGAPRIGFLTLAPAFLACLIVLTTILSMPHDYKKDEGLQGVSSFLEANGMTYGYATFWNAQAITVLSDSKVKVRNIDIDETGDIAPHPYQSQSTWFKPQPEPQTYFLLLTDWEYSQLASGDGALDNRVETLTYPGYQIVVLDSCPFG